MPYILTNNAPFTDPNGDEKVRTVLPNGETILTDPKCVINSTEWDGYRRDFKDHFKHVSTAELANDRFDVPWTEVTSKLATVAAPAGSSRAIKVHYGFANGGLAWALEVMELKPLGGMNYQVRTIADAFFVFDLLHNVLIKRPIGDWNAPRSEYISNVRVIRKMGDMPDTLKTSGNLDPLTYIVPFEFELLLLKTMNTVGATPDADFWMACCSIGVESDLYGTGKEFRHAKALHIVQNVAGAPKDLLDNTAIVGYKGKAADLGNLCPPGCPGYVRSEMCP